MNEQHLCQCLPRGLLDDDSNMPRVGTKTFSCLEEEVRVKDKAMLRNGPTILAVATG